MWWHDEATDKVRIMEHARSLAEKGIEVQARQAAAAAEADDVP